MKNASSLTKNPQEIVGFKARIHEKVTRIIRFADWLTEFFGSTWFLIANAVIFAFWIVLNVGVIPGFRPFDPFPFNFLTMTVSLEAIFLSVIVLMSQNRAAKLSDRREEAAFEINFRTEAEVTKLLIMVDEIRQHLGLSPDTDPEFSKMKEKTDVEAIEREIEGEKT